MGSEYICRVSRFHILYFILSFMYSKRSGQNQEVLILVLGDIGYGGTNVIWGVLVIYYKFLFYTYQVQSLVQVSIRNAKWSMTDWPKERKGFKINGSAFGGEKSKEKSVAKRNLPITSSHSLPLTEKTACLFLKGCQLKLNKHQKPKYSCLQQGIHTESCGSAGHI